MNDDHTTGHAWSQKVGTASTTLLALLTAALLGASACRSEQETRTELGLEREAGPESGDPIRKGEPMSTKATSSPSKADYQKKLAEQLEQWRTELGQLEDKARDLELESKATMNELRAKGTELEAKLDELKRAGEGAWDELRHGIDAAYYDLRAATERARQSLLQES